MREPRRVHASAGFAPKPLVFNALSLIRALIASPYAPNPLDDRPFELDVSEFNNIKMSAVAAYTPVPCRAVIIRIGGSASVRDKKFVEYWTDAKAVGLPRSIYTYTWPGWTVDQHVRNFMNSVNEWTPGDLGEGPIWVDVETHANKSRKHVSDHAIGYIQALERETGKVVGWYSADWFAKGFMELQDWMADKWAWWAQWLANQPREHPGPVSHISIIPDNKIAIHQTGSNCDARLFGGTGRVDTDRQVTDEDLFGEPTQPPSSPLAAQVASNTAAIAQILKGARLMNGGSNG